jgi:hypothetical protein
MQQAMLLLNTAVRNVGIWCGVRETEEEEMKLQECGRKRENEAKDKWKECGRAVR